RISTLSLHDALPISFALSFAFLRHSAWLSEAAQGYFDLAPASAWGAAFALCVGFAAPLGALLGVLLLCAARLSRFRRLGASAASDRKSTRLNSSHVK